jgi:hypothetical protein
MSLEKRTNKSQRLKEIFPGVYSPGKVNLENQSAAVLAVHPYFDKPKDLTVESAKKIVDFYQQKIIEWTESLEMPGISESANAEINAELSALRYKEKKALRQFDYMSKLENLVKTNEGPLIVLETQNSFHNTVSRFTKLGRKAESYFIKTLPGDPNPLEMPASELLAFLSFFNQHPIKLVGGYYWEDCKWPGGVLKRPWGCLGYTEYKLYSNNITYKVLKDITFE